MNNKLKIIENKMTKADKRLIRSLEEAIAYAQGDKTKGRETKIEVWEPVEITETVDTPSFKAKTKLLPKSGIPVKR